MSKRGLPTKLQKLYRTIEFERAEDGAPVTDEGKRFRVALSSETPVARWFGQEILDHSAGCVDMTRCDKRGLPLLMDHNTADQVGRIEDVAIEDKKLRGWMRFGKSARAGEVAQDVADGIRTDMSIGYRVQEMAQMPLVDPADDDEEPVYRAVRWMPMEGSMVAVPADMEAGVGRSGDDSALPVEVVAVASAPVAGAAKEVRMAEPITAPATPAAQVVETAPKNEAKEIAALAREHGFERELGQWIEAGLTKVQVADQIMALLKKRADDTITHAGGDVLGMTEKEKRSYSLCRAVMAQVSGDWSKAGFEREVSKALDSKIDKDIPRHGGFLVPTVLPVMTRAQPPLVAGTNSVGGYAVFTEPMAFIELLRNNMVLNQTGAQYLTGLQGPVAFPRQITAGTATWQAEATSIAGSYLTIDQLTMNAKTLQSQTGYSRQLLTQSTPDIDAMVRNDLALIHAIALDLAGLNGQGTAQPDGLLHLSGVGSYTIGTNGGAAAYSDWVALEKSVELANALRGSLAYVTNPKVKAQARVTPKLSNTIALPVWEGPGLQGSINGYPAFSTTQIPSNITKGTSTTICSAAIFGNFRELIVGEWGAFEVITDPYTQAVSGIINLVTFQMADVGVRHKLSFYAVQDIVA